MIKTISLLLNYSSLLAVVAPPQVSATSGKIGIPSICRPCENAGFSLVNSRLYGSNLRPNFCLNSVTCDYTARQSMWDMIKLMMLLFNYILLVQSRRHLWLIKLMMLLFNYILLVQSRRHLWLIKLMMLLFNYSPRTQVGQASLSENGKVQKDTFKFVKLLKLLNFLLCFLQKKVTWCPEKTKKGKPINTARKRKRSMIKSGAQPLVVKPLVVRRNGLLLNYSPRPQVAVQTSLASLLYSPHEKMGSLEGAQPCVFTGKNVDSSSQNLVYKWTKFLFMFNHLVTAIIQVTSDLVAKNFLKITDTDKGAILCH